MQLHVHELAKINHSYVYYSYGYKGYSVGGIYAVLMNLPRAIRYKQENVLHIGLIPGPKEPDHDINSFFLNPMVEELKGFW